MNNKYKAQWEQADSLMNKGLPQSAEKIVQNILHDAENNEDHANAIKAKMTLMSLENVHSETSLPDNINKAATEAEKAIGAEKAIWQNITAGMYWQYYQNNRWQILNRTVMENTVSDDIATWDAKTFVQKTTGLYLASISGGDLLKKIPVNTYLPLIIEGKNTRSLRPTLYDLLVFRAIDFFSNDEKDVTNPSYKFEIDNPVWFQDAKAFSEVRMKIADANSLHYKALQLYQDIIAFHLNDAQPDALIDADLQRLQFVYSNAVSADKDSLYLEALQSIETKYSGYPAAAQVSFLIQQQLYNSSYDNEDAAFDQSQTSNSDLPQIVQRLQQIADRYPDTEGAINAYNLIQTIQHPLLSVTTEQVALPGKNIKALVQYKNSSRAYLSLYRVAIDITDTRSYGYNNKKLIKGLPESALVRSWEQALPDSDDMKQHRTEMNAGTLETGQYLLVISDRRDVLDTMATSSYTRLQVSTLSIITNPDKSTGFILNRESGMPVNDVSVHFYKQQYNKKKQGYENIEAASAKSNMKGKLSLPSKSDNTYYNNSFSKLLLIKAKDTLVVDNFYNYATTDNDNGPMDMRTFFFTDRSIYRPGQTIYFKGIIVSNKPSTGVSHVVPHTATEVTFYDVNGQKITFRSFTTNEFGSFNGSFTAPDGLLTGAMYISDDNGAAHFNVEEYKRPKFYVDFDTLKDAYALNQAVQVKGFARTYAGSNLDGAVVKYRVVRKARFPFYWCYYRWGMPSSPEMEIANGTVATQADGSFEIILNTIPDKKINPKSLPVFTYTVYADITDVNGETRSGNVVVNSGYRSLQIIADIPEDADPEGLDSIHVSTQNLNSVFTAAGITMTIAPLQFPGRLFRERLWQQPDKFIMTESEFHTAFPDDEYKNESDYHNWKEQNTVYEKSFTTKQDSKIKIPASIWEHNGWYVITLKAKDAQDNEIIEKKYTHIWNPANKEPVQKKIILQSNQESYEPGNNAMLQLATAYGNPYLLYTSSLKVYSIDNFKSPIVFKKTVTEADRGNITFSYLYIHNNRVYTAEKTLVIPWSDKDLQIAWATHRDKMQPGAQDEWTMTIKGNKKEKVAAELLAGMYDASLDAFMPHQWNIDKLVPYRYQQNNWNSRYQFGSSYPVTINDININSRDYNKKYDRFIWSGYSAMIRYKAASRSYANASYDMAEEAITGAAAPNMVMEVKLAAPGTTDSSAPPPPTGENGNINELNDNIAVRTNLNETAFFFPQLQTDSNGNVTFKFTMPEALTEWKLMAFAHTKDWKTGYLEGKVKTQKDLMVVPNLPRFFRQGDDMVITTKINSLADKDLSGIATLEILNATTLQPMELPFKLLSKEQSFSVAAHQSTTASWNAHIPESVYGPVVVRITARAGNFTDGEENTLPVITNRMLVTETLPLPMRGNEEKTFTLDKLKNANSNILVNRSLTVEFAGNPAWYAVQALPYLMDYPYECAEQTFNRFYANALAAHIIAQSPKVEAIFNQWKNEDTAALMSNLSKNQELKSALLEETPWVMEAKDETEQKHRIALLFETHKLAKELSKNLNKLEQMQLPEGGFPWFSGMHSDRYITQYIITGLARLQHLGVSLADKAAAQKMINNALPYLDRMLKSDYDDLIKYKAKLDEQHIGYTQIQYLYMRSFYKDPVIDKTSQKAFDYYKNQAAKYWSNFNPYMKGMIALASNSLNDAKTANDIIASLKETAVHNDEMGMYWKTMPRGYWWYEAPVEAQSLLIEAFQEVAKDESAVDEMKTWLLKQKQTQNWQTTKATADACYALLLTGSDWLANEPLVTINLGDVKTIHSSDIKTEAGTGYFKQIIEGKEVQPAMGTITVKVQYPNSKLQNNSLKSQVSNLKSQVSWGAVYWQYFEDMDKITAAATPLSVTKELFIERNSDAGPMLTEIKDGNQLQVGDKVKVRIVLKADRDMEYVHLKDMRGACFEPVAVLSGYRYQNGLGYYESTKDVSTNFFFDRINKGTYVLEYTVFVNQKGDFSNGIATAQCMYAPEFSSHTEGIRIKVE